MVQGVLYLHYLCIEKKYYQTHDIDLSFTLTPISKEIVLKHLLDINTSKDAGLDKLAGKFLKEGAAILASPITDLCNLTIR